MTYVQFVELQKSLTAENYPFTTKIIDAEEEIYFAIVCLREMIEPKIVKILSDAPDLNGLLTTTKTRSITFSYKAF